MKVSKKSIIVLISFVFLYACGYSGGVINPTGMIAKEQLKLIIIALALMLSVVIPVIILVLYYSYKYSDKRKNIDDIYDPSWTYSHRLEILCWGIPIMIVMFLSYLCWTTTHDLDPYKRFESKNETLEVQVISLQWKWLFIYPKYNIATINELYAPIDSTIAFSMTADAPMNAMWIPQLGGMIYSMAGMSTKLHLVGNKIGVYDGLSASYSGLGFSNMKFKAHIVSLEDFQNWVTKLKSQGKVLTKSEYEKLLEDRDESGNKIMLFSSIEGNLFTDVINKYMMIPEGLNTRMPMPHGDHGAHSHHGHH